MEREEKDENTSLVRMDMDSADDNHDNKQDAEEEKVAGKDAMQENAKLVDNQEINAANTDLTSDVEDKEETESPKF